MNLINVIVKTLDGRNHSFSVPEDITVLQFKNIILEKMEIAIDRQRLLFQGRVLQDDNSLSSYNVAGNVMHLVTRPPPSQIRPQSEASTEREENSDINRDQIRNILSDVFGNINDISNPLGVSVNNEGNRVDITVNMPSTNRLSLARLRQNYVHRLMNQARELIENLRDPTHAAPRPDRDRLYQANAYDLGANEERITEVTAQPLPIHNLADMIHSVRDLWREAEPQLELWENVLRRQNLPESISSSDREMQRMHDSASRYIHLFSHMLHIMSDYLVEFQHNTHTRISVPRNVNEPVTPTNEAATSTSVDENVSPLTGGFGESALPHSDTASEANSSATVTPDLNADTNDRNRYLYVFSEMPAQLLQVRLDVDSTIQMPGVHSARRPQAEPASTTAPTNATAANNTTPTAPVPTTEPVNTARPPRRRDAQFPSSTMENLFRTSLQDSFGTGSTSRNQGSNPRTMRTGTQLAENVDPYVRCQSRHFQNPSNLRSGAVISTFGGIRFRESSRPRPARSTGGTTSNTTTGHAGTADNNTPVSTANNTNAASSNTHATSHMTSDMRQDGGDPIRSFLGGLINSIFTTSGDGSLLSTNDNIGAATLPRTTTVPTAIPNNNIGGLPNDLSRFIQTMTANATNNLETPLGQLFPEIFTGYNSDTDNNITNQIIELVVNRLTMIDFTQIFHGVYQPLNALRIPLQNLLQRHQQQCDGSRDRMLEHVVKDLEFFNRVYMSIFDRLRGNESVNGLSDDARNNFNQSIDIPRTINNLNLHHARVVVDMILRSPTDIGFGQLLVNSMFSHHEESLALLDIICNNNDELRQYMVRSFIESLMTSMDDSPDNLSQFINQSRNTFGLDWIFGNVNSRLFRRPDQLTELRETVLSLYVVYIDNSGDVIAPVESVCVSMPMDTNVMDTNMDCLEDMVNCLSGNVVTNSDIPIAPLNGVVSDLMDVCNNYQQDLVTNHATNGSSNLLSSLPVDWRDIVSRDSNIAVDQQTMSIPYSDAYVSGMPPKRRKIIFNQRHRNIQVVPDMMNDCIDQAIRASGVNNDSHNMQPIGPALSNAFQDLVSDHVRNRLVNENINFPTDRYPSTEQNFNRKKRSEEDKKNN